MLNRAAIAGLIPHHGRMCLLDRADAWDRDSIRCASGAHRDPDNPLRRDGRLPPVCTIELGLQAMALHGALIAGAPQPQGFVTSLNEVELAVLDADDLPGELTVTAVLLAAEARGYLYRFEVGVADRRVSSGRAMIMIPDGS